MAQPVPLQITFRSMKPSDALARRIIEKMGKLRRLHPRILGCRVIVEALPVNGKGSLFTVHTRVSLPSAELVATHDGDPARTHDNVYVALRDSMEAIQRQLRAHVHRHRDRRRGPPEPRQLARAS